MPSFFHDTTIAASADHNTSKQNFNLFSKEKKAEPTPQKAAPLPPLAKELTALSTLKPPVVEQRKASLPQRESAKQDGTDIDDELRQPDTFLAFDLTAPASPPRVKEPTPPPTPVEEQRKSSLPQ
jgi:hypothetical protein